MASSINLDVDAATDSKVDLREGSITDNTNHVKRPSAESSKSDMLSSNTQKKKKKKNKSIKSISAKRSSATKTSGKTRIKTPKKVSIMDEKLSSNDGSDTGSSTETSSDSEPIAKTNPPSKKGKSKKSARAHRKPGKSTRSHPQSDESDAETIDTTDADDTRDDGAQKELALVKQQLQLLTRQIAGLGGSGLGGIGLAKGYQFNTGGLSTGVPGGNLSGYNGDQSLGIARVANGSTPSRSLGGRRPPPPGGRRYVGGGDDSCNEEDDEDGYLHGHERGSDIKGRIPGKRQQRLEFRRVDQVWDSNIHNFKLQDTAESGHNSRYDEYLFNVRRTFDWEGKYKATVVDIKSKQLREALSDVMGNIKGISLVEETPKLDPNMLFLYLEDLREHMANLKDLEPEGKTKKERKKVQKWIDQKRRHLRVLMQYLDKDYALVKKRYTTPVIVSQSIVLAN